MKLFNPAPAPGRVRRRVVGGAAAAVLGATAVFGSGLMTAAHADDPVAVSRIVLGVGAKEDQRVVSWYASADTAQKVQVAPTALLVNGEFPADAVTFSADVAANIVNGGFNGHATISSLKENTTYSYRVGADGAWSSTESFKTHDFEGDFDFLFYGDPQIGSSGDTAKDGAGWADTLDVSLAANPDAELLVSGGDQVESANVESQWDAFLGSDKLRQVPWVATIGNHDVGGKAYEQHFWTPNTDRSAPYYAGNAATQSGGDYWFIHKDTLFIDLNSNAYGNGSDAAHVAYVTDIVNQHGDEAKYTVLVYHHAIYSPAAHANDGDNKLRRLDFPTAFSNLGVDLVLQGHDHSYSRSYVLKNGQKANPDEQPGASEVAAGPGGVIYVTSNSASGSKYYDLTNPIPGSDFGPDPLNPTNHYANSVENQEHVRTYVKVEVRHDKLVVENIRSGTCAAPNAAVERGNVSWCGPDSGASPAQPVGSKVDAVAIRPFHGEGQDIQVDVPKRDAGEFGWEIDGTNGLVSMGEAAEKDNAYFEASGSINPITVTDTRYSGTPWYLHGQVSDFQDGDKTFASKYLGWEPSVITAGGGGVAGAKIAPGFTTGSGLAVSRSLGGASASHEIGSTKLGADLSLQFPISVDKGNYRARLTLTAVS